MNRAVESRQRTGMQREPVLWLHGAAERGAIRMLMAEPDLADRYWPILFQWAGRAGEPRPMQSAYFARLARGALAQLAHLRVQRAHVAAFGSGGAVAWQAALRGPGVVHSVALLEPSELPPQANTVQPTGAPPSCDRCRIPQPLLSVFHIDPQRPELEAMHQRLLRWLPQTETLVIPGTAPLLPPTNSRALAVGLANFFARHRLPAG